MLAPAGRGVLVAGVLLYAAGWWLGYPEAVVLGFGCLLAVGAAVLWTLPRPRLSVRRRVIPRKVARGDPAHGVVTLVNEGRRVRGLRAVDRCGDENLAVQVPALAAGASHEVRYRLPTGRRGQLPVGPMQTVRTDPLGLARRVQRYGTLDVLLVRPRTCALPLLSSGRAHHVEGPSSASADDGTITFHALREYVLGDDLRRVHWRYTARTGTLMVRQMVDVSLPHTTIVLDTRPAAYPAGDQAADHSAGGSTASPDAFELAVDAAASVALAAARSNFPVKIVTTAGRMVETEGAATDADTLLDWLAQVTQSAAGTLAAAFEDVAHGRAGGSLVVVTGLGDTTGLKRLATVRGRYDRAAVVQAGDVDQAAKNASSGGTVPADVTLMRVGSLQDLMSAWRWEAVR